MKTKSIEILIIVGILLALSFVVGCKDETKAKDPNDYTVFIDCTFGLTEPNEPVTDEYNTRNNVYAILRKAGVEDVHKCLQWAFGEDENTIKISQWDDRWRQRHPELLTVHGYDDLYVSINKIAVCYLLMNDPNALIFPDPNEPDIILFDWEQEYPIDFAYYGKDGWPVTFEAGGVNEIICDATREEWLRVLYTSMAGKEPNGPVNLIFEEPNEPD